MIPLLLGSGIALTCTALALHDLRQLLSRRALERRTEAQRLHEWVGALKRERGLSEELVAVEALRQIRKDQLARRIRQHGPRRYVRFAQREATHAALRLAVGG